MTLSRRFLFGAAVAAPAALAGRVLAADPKPTKAVASLEIKIDTESMRAVVRDEAQRIMAMFRTYNREHLWGPTSIREKDWRV